MYLVYVIYGSIILVSFITGLIITKKDKYKDIYAKETSVNNDTKDNSDTLFDNLVENNSIQQQVVGSVKEETPKYTNNEIIEESNNTQKDTKKGLFGASRSIDVDIEILDEYTRRLNDVINNRAIQEQIIDSPVNIITEPINENVKIIEEVVSDELGENVVRLEITNIETIRDDVKKNDVEEDEENIINESEIMSPELV